MELLHDRVKKVGKNLSNWLKDRLNEYADWCHRDDIVWTALPNQTQGLFWVELTGMMMGSNVLKQQADSRFSFLMLLVPTNLTWFSTPVSPAIFALLK